MFKHSVFKHSLGCVQNLGLRRAACVQFVLGFVFIVFRFVFSVFGLCLVVFRLCLVCWVDQLCLGAAPHPRRDLNTAGKRALLDLCLNTSSCVQNTSEHNYVCSIVFTLCMGPLNCGITLGIRKTHGSEESSIHGLRLRSVQL